MSAAVSPAESFIYTQSSCRDAPSRAIKYETVAAVVCHFGNNSSNSNAHTEAVSSKAANGSARKKSHRSHKRKLSLAKFADLKSKSKRWSCGRYENWASEYAPDRSFSFTVKSTKTLSGKEAGRNYVDNKKALKLNMVTFANNQINAQRVFITLTNLSHRAPIDGGVPYAALGIEVF